MLGSAFIDSARRKGFGRALTHAFKSRGLDPNLARAVSSSIKRAASPLEAARRRRPRSDAIPEALGWRRVDDMPGAPALVHACQAMLAERKAGLLESFTPPYCFVTRIADAPGGPIVARPSDLEPIVRFIEQPAVLELLTGYLGEVPVISNVSLIYTPPNEATVGPQQIHRDMNHPRQLHVIVALDEVTDDCGPFTFLPADESHALARRIRHSGGRVPDEQVDLSRFLRCTGPAGTVWFVNSGACFHFGARARKRPRYILIVNCVPFHEGAEGGEALYRAVNRAALDNGDPVRRLLLRL